MYPRRPNDGPERRNKIRGPFQKSWSHDRCTDRARLVYWRTKGIQTRHVCITTCVARRRSRTARTYATLFRMYPLQRKGWQEGSIGLVLEWLLICRLVRRCCCLSVDLGLHCGEEQDVSDRARVRQHHDEAINAHTLCTTPKGENSSNHTAQL